MIILINATKTWREIERKRREKKHILPKIRMKWQTNETRPFSYFPKGNLFELRKTVDMDAK